MPANMAMTLRANRRAQNVVAHRVKTLPTAVKEAFVIGNWEMATQQLTKAIEEGHPWALTAWLNAAGAFPNFAQGLERLLEAIGVKSEDEARRKIELGTKLERLQNDASTDLNYCVTEATELLVLALRELPDRRAEVLARLEAA